jgi:hypothetical protein
VSVWSEEPLVSADSAILSPTGESSQRPPRRTVDATPVVSLPAPPSAIAGETLDLPWTFITDAVGPPLLASTPILLMAAVTAIEPEVISLDGPPQEPQPARAVTAAFDRTGSAILLAFRKTGEGVKSAFGVLVQ